MIDPNTINPGDHVWTNQGCFTVAFKSRTCALVFKGTRSLWVQYAKMYATKEETYHVRDYYQ